MSNFLRFVGNLLSELLLRRLTVWALTALLLNCACQPQKSSNPELTLPAMTAAEVKALVSRDLEEMVQANDERETEALRSYDKSHAGIFSQIFGGPSKDYARTFIDERIKYFLTAEELQAWQVPSLQSQQPNWINKPDGEAEKKIAEKNAQVVATNSGMALWLEAVIFGSNPMLNIPGRGVVPVDSARIGIVVIGPAYQPTRPFRFENEGVKIVVTSPEYRQRTLVHEARHSDCTGGLTRSDLETMRQIRSLKEFMERYPNPACGHIHSNCPDGHVLAGIPACDRHPWGAYSIDAIYTEGTLAAMSAGSRANDYIARVIGEMQVLDSWSRVLVKKEDLLSGRLGQPDMSSVDVQREQ